MITNFLSQIVLLFAVALQATGCTCFANGNEQVIETTDSHPFWVVTDNPELWRAAQEVVNENGVILYHENIGVTEDGYWVEAKDLKVGDVFIGANGALSTLVNKERVEFANGITVYNFTVDGNHDYFVIAQTAELGQTSVLVHNAGYHDHHIVMKGKFRHRKQENRKYVIDVQDLLRENGIDIANDAANRIFNVLNKGHSVAYAKRVWEDLSGAVEDAIKSNPTSDIRQVLVDKLQDIYKQIENGTYMQ
jgi:hypothetical protein